MMHPRVLGLLAGAMALGSPLFGQIARTITVPNETYTAYDIPEDGSDLVLHVVPQAGYAIDCSAIAAQDASDDVQWQPAGGHTYNIGTVFSSREWLSVTGLYHKITGEGGPGPHPKFNGRVSAVDVDMSGALEETEETVGIWLAKGGSRKAVTIREVQQIGPSKYQALSWEAGRVSLWTAMTGGTQLAGNTKTLSALSSHLYYVQGDLASASVRDGEIGVAYSDGVSYESAHDWVKLTVVGATTTPFTVMAVGQTTDVTVTLSPDSPGTNVTVSLNPLEGTGDARFWPSGQASTTLTASATLTVTGVTASSTASNLLLRVLLAGEALVSNRFSVLSVDLDIWNGGSDLDNGQTAGSQGAQVPEGSEVSTGAYVLVNWDDDDADRSAARGRAARVRQRLAQGRPELGALPHRGHPRPARAPGTGGDRQFAADLRGPRRPAPSRPRARGHRRDRARQGAGQVHRRGHGRAVHTPRRGRQPAARAVRRGPRRDRRANLRR